MNLFDRLMQEEYDRWGKNPPLHAWCSPDRTKKEVNFLKRTLQLSRKHTILDLFCSWGRHAIVLASQGYNVIGLDISQPMISRAKEQAAINGCSVRFERIDFNDMNYNAEFDIIYSIQSSPFEAWRQPEEVLDMLKRVRTTLKANGLYLFGWSDNWNRADVAEPRWREMLEKRGITIYDKAELPFHYYGKTEQIEQIHKAGFSLVETYNCYDMETTFDEDKPGLIMIVRNE